MFRETITPTCFRRYRGIAVQLNITIYFIYIYFFFIKDTLLNLVLLVEPPSKGNYRKVPFLRAYQHDYGWI